MPKGLTIEWLLIMSYKNAFRCKYCPESNNKDGCPAWIELIWENTGTGEKKTEKGCYFQLSPKLMLESVKAANIGSQHASELRNSLVLLKQKAEERLKLTG